MPLTISYNLTPITNEFRANYVTAGDQENESVLGLSNGGFVAAYHTAIGNQFSIALDFFNGAHQHITGPIEATDDGSIAALGNLAPGLTQLANGNMLVVWTDLAVQDRGIRGRLFSPTGTPVSGELDLSNDTSLDNVQVTALRDGGFVVSAARRLSGPDNDAVLWYKYDDAGNYQSERVVSTTELFVGTVGGLYPRIAALAGGGFVVTYADTNGSGFDADSDIRAAIFNESGSVRKADFFIAGNAPQDETLSSPDVAGLKNGGFAVVYSSPNLPGEGDTTGIVLSILTSAGTNPIYVHVNNADDAANERDARVEVLANGFILVTWNRQSDNPDFYGRIFTQSGVPVDIDGFAGQFLIKGDRENGETSATIDGRFVSVWEDPSGDGSGTQIAARVREVTRFGVGSEGNDSFSGDELRDTLFGSGGNDTLNGLDADDFLAGEDGNDVLRGGQGKDLLFGGENDDTVDGGVGDDTLNGDAGNDSLIGGIGSDTLVGGPGHDTLRSGAGVEGLFSADTLSGGDGNDTYILDNVHTVIPQRYAYDSVGEAANAGTDQVLVQRVVSGLFGLGQYTLTANVENGIIQGTGSFNLTGNAITNVLRGNDAANILSGLAATDFLIGNAGADTLDGGSGSDQMVGGLGDDFMYVDNANDLVFEDAGGGSDRVFANVSYRLLPGAQVERLTTTNNFGTGAINLTGSDFANAIYGNAGANTLDGRGGADSLIGFGGNDLFFVDTAGDTVFEATGEGADRVLASVSYTLKAGSQVEIMSTTNHGGIGAINLTGNEFANTIFGNAGANTLDGRGGTDSLVGFGGNDFFFVDNADDAVTEKAGEGAADRVLASVTYRLGAGDHIEIMSTANNAGTGAINLTGNEFANAIFGNGGANILNGGLGNDTLVGFGGSDSFLFNTALNASTNVDRLADFNVAADTIRLENAIFTTMAAGTLAAGAFRVGAGAADADDRIVYNSATGALIYDSNGNLAGGATQFATLSTGLALTNADFIVV